MTRSAGLGPLVPAATLDLLHPPNTAYAPRSSRARTRWVMDADYKLDALTGVPVALLGAMPLICHRGAATPAALELFARAGLARPERLFLYDTEAEAVALAKSLAASGYRLAYIHPPPEALGGTGALLVSPDRYAAMNDKANLAELVYPGLLPPRRLLSPEDAFRLPFPGRPTYLKAGHGEASGGGAGVAYCASADDWRTAMAWFAECGLPIRRMVIEEAVAVRRSWCFSIAVLDECVRYLGAAMQLLGAPGRQVGSRIDPDAPPPEAAVQAAVAIGEQSRRQGYRGIAGFDIGADAGGRLFVFDLNFRINSSTAFVLLHAAATARIGATVTQSVNATFDAPLGGALRRLEPLIDEGRFVPTRLYDGAAGGCSVVTGMATGATADEADALARSTAALLAERQDDGSFAQA
jgi:hypothetical protein